ncbi:MAG: SWIM zinc finger family protein [Phototrophicaceae bacterium]
MNPYLPAWSMERITLLAPDTSSSQSGREIANTQHSAWQAIASDGFSAWAVYQDKKKTPYKIKIDLLKIRHNNNVWDCNCRTYKTPCKHIIALLYMLINEPDAITQASPPNWVEEWLDKEALSARKREERKQKNDIITPERIAQRQKQSAKRKQKITGGLEELEQWLVNMIRRGLTDPQVQTEEFWHNRAARLVDAQAPGIASWLREMSTIPSTNADWIADLLEQLGRLYLLIESFKRYDLLSVETQADLRTMVGWHIKRDEMVFYDTLKISDTWQVIGQYTGDVIDNNKKSTRRGLKTQRIWLRGIDSGRNALILEFTFGDSAFETIRQVGSAFKAELSFFPSSSPLRAFISDFHDEESTKHQIIGQTITESIEDYAKTIAKNPWLMQYPFVLEEVIPLPLENQWIVREVDGTYLPIDEAFPQIFNLFAVSGGHPIRLSGEWNGTSFYPTGAMVDERIINFNMDGKFNSA